MRSKSYWNEELELLERELLEWGSKFKVHSILQISDHSLERAYCNKELELLESGARAIGTWYWNVE